MKILVDTDVLLDVALDRRAFVKPAMDLLDRLERREATGFIAWHTAANFYYLVRPRRGKADARSMLLDLMAFVAIAPTTTESLLQAGRLELRDFEDAMQVAAGLACGAEVIATRNVRDYGGAPIQATHPADLLKVLS
ncbi:MAG: type II toxin-antitoxin system VapC family toxin [Planctomycetota bacterium]